MTTEIKPSNIEKFLEMLVDNVARIEMDTAELDDEQLAQSKDGEWSVTEILAHLRACDDVWTMTIQQMLVIDNPELPEIHPQGWSKRMCYDQLEFDEMFTPFQLRRYELFRLLTSLEFEDWQRSCVINGRTHTIYSQVRRMALHEAQHCDDIELLCRK